MRSRHPAHRNPVAAAIYKRRIEADIARLKAAAELHAWAGDSAPKLVQEAGSLLYIVSWAAGECGIDPDGADMRILRGMASALGDLAADLDSVEAHRPALQSGLLAIERILPALNPWAIGLGAVELDRAMASGGFGTHDIVRMHGMDPA